MKTRKLSEGLEVSDLGYGAMSLSHGYGEATDRKDAVKILRQALDCGYTYFDTAEVYGPYINEEIVGEALKPFRDEVVISTKFGISFSEYTHGDIIPDARPEKIRQSVEGSLKRLQTETIDLYFQLRHWGVSVAPEEYIRRAHKVTPISAVQDRYSMMARGIEKLFPTLEELGIGFVAYSPLANGLLSGAYEKATNNKFEAVVDYRSRMPQFTPEAMKKNEELMAFLQKTAEEHRATMSQLSLAWMLGKHSWLTAIPSSRRLERIVENAGGAVVKLSAEEIKAIDEALDKLPKSDIFGVKNN